ncbi:MAG: NAD(P)-binding protein [Phycisphaera sp.]|nr:NAD(P)-binding protein [Phycisphaera sp.]
MMSWLLASIPVLVLVLFVLLLVRRHHEMQGYARSHRERRDARERGTHTARLQYPDIDLGKCLGCGACVRACPEDGVLSLLHGQAVVVHGARCVGHGLCATACPTAAIAITLGDLSDRKDLPALGEDLEAVNVPGLFVAGELGGFALVRTAVTQGAAVADAVAKKLNGHDKNTARHVEASVFDLLVVGAGPAGLSCSLRARQLGLAFTTVEQEERIGGTVAAYPRRKMVMTQPVELPLHGRLNRQTYQKEELIALWERVWREHDLPIRTGVRVEDFARDSSGVFTVHTSVGPVRARNVCLALGRRGSPRKLGVPGEELPKVAYSLLDAESYTGRKVLVVGGGDSAVEAALGLAEQPGNEVSISYRKGAFTRLKTRNENRLHRAVELKRVRVYFESEVEEITRASVRLRCGRDGAVDRLTLANDDVFVFAGGVPPFALLERGGVSFDPADRPTPTEPGRGSGVLVALMLLLCCTALMYGWVNWHRAYYDLAAPVRAGSPLHGWLRPAGAVGLTFGFLACALFLCNLAYLIKRSKLMGRRLPGSLGSWMSAHIFTGLLAPLCVLLHAGLSIRDTVGGHAFVALLVVVVTGILGRYLYALVPRAANGREMDLDELCTQLSTLSAEWDRGGRGFGSAAREQIDSLIHAGRWRAGFLARVWALLAGQFKLRRVLHNLRQQAQSDDIATSELHRVQGLARRAFRISQAVSHYEEVRAVLSSWRYFHRWVALLMVLLAVVHIAIAIRYADIEWWWPIAAGGVS